LDLHIRRNSGKLAPSEVDHLEREINGVDSEIDNVVFKLYGISRDMIVIKIVSLETNFGTDWRGTDLPGFLQPGQKLLLANPQ
jgi:hypothetical protein